MTSGKQIVFLIILVAVAIASFFYFSNREYSIYNYPSEGESIIVFGDSLVEGIGAKPGNDFPSMLADRVGVSIINAGVSGDTTESALLRIEKDVLSLEPKVVIVLLGGNDVIQKVPKERTFENLRTIISLIQEEGAIAILVGLRTGIFGGDYQNDFKRLAKDMGAGYVPDILNGIFGNTDLMYDTIHPNDRGNSIMADRIEPVLRRVLE